MAVSVQKYFEQRLQIDPNRVYEVQLGAADVNIRQYDADTATNNQMNWNITTPSVRVGLDRKIVVDVIYQITGTRSAGAEITVNAANRTAPQGGLRQYPLHQTSEVMQLRLNNQAFTMEAAESIGALTNYGNDNNDRQVFMSGAPHLPDQSSVISDIAGPLGYRSGGTRSPYANYGNSNFVEDSRNIHYFTCDANGEPKFYIDDFQISVNPMYIRIQETLMMSPMVWGKMNHQCLFGIQQLNLSLTLRDPKKILAGIVLDNGATGLFGMGNAQTATIIVDVVNSPKPKLHLTFLVPQPDIIIPPLLQYPYYQLQHFKQSKVITLAKWASNVANLNDGGLRPTKERFTTNNITLHEIPKRVYIYAAISDVSSTDEATISTEKSVVRVQAAASESRYYQAPDTYLAITGMTVNFDSQNGRLSTLTEYDLHRLCVDNGLQRSFLDVTRSTGQVLCLEFGKDITLNPLLAPGVRGNFQFNYNVSVASLIPALDTVYAANQTYDLHTVFVPEGILTIEDQLVAISIGALTEQIVMEAPFAYSPGGQPPNYQGGSFWKDVGRFMTGTLPGLVKSSIPIATDVASMVGQMSPAAPMMKQAARAIKKATGGRKTGGGLRGGKKVRSSSLAHRL